MNGFRDDGACPTIATGSKIVLISMGVLMSPRWGLHLMGFPAQVLDFKGASKSQLSHVLGNTMCVGTIGCLQLAALSALKRE